MGETLRPLFDQLVVKELKAGEDVRESGLVMPATREDAKRPPQVGIVLAAGPGLDWWEGSGVQMPVKVGDKVMFHYSHGAPVVVAEEELLVLRVGMVLGVLEG